MNDTKTEGEQLEQQIDAATEAVRVQAERLDEIHGAASSNAPMGLAHFMDVPVRITVEVGRTTMSLAELVKLGPGSLVALDREAHEPADVLVNGKVVARGEIVTIKESYGIRITSVLQGR
ncbi:MAG: flagellar motor switch protein FliN [Planctomycetota bacterium]